MSMSDFFILYSGFHSPIAELNCGDRCAPYNERGVPFCCDTRHAVPTAYQEEWEYLRLNTALWHLWDPGNSAQKVALQKQTPKGQVLVECLGHTLCQRNFRALTCRAFPFFPYITREGEFVGLSTYWEYEDRCWVISNLHVVSREYLAQFLHTYERLFELKPEELENFHYFSTQMRRVFGRRHRAITLLHRNGNFYKVTPRDGRMRRVSPDRLPKYGFYLLASQMPFPDER